MNLQDKLKLVMGTEFRFACVLQRLLADFEALVSLVEETGEMKECADSICAVLESSLRPLLLAIEQYRAARPDVGVSGA